MTNMLAQIKEIIGLASLSVWIVLCLVLGGASAAGILANATLQAAGLAIILFFAWRYVTTAVGQRAFADISGRPGQSLAPILWIATGIAIWIVVQLMPLPAGPWQSLGARELISQGDKLLGLGNVSRPFSMQPNATLNSGSWLIVPVATFLLTIGARNKARTFAGYAIVAIAIVSAILGVVQIGQGPNSSAYFYAITNANTSVGFFANSNHLATLYLCALAICPWLFFEEDDGRRKKPNQALGILSIAVIAMLVLNIALNRSLAGYILVLPVAAFVILQHPAGREGIARLPFSARTLMIGLAVITLVMAWLMLGVFSEFAVGLTDPDTRLSYYAQTFDIAKAAAPFGIGLGAFRWVFAGYEDPSAVDQVYINHAHNDYIELLAEGGIIAVIFVALFAVWLFRRLVRLRGLPTSQLPLQFASAMVIGIVALHSLVDYPARTAAIAAIAAFAIANLAVSPQQRRRQVL